MRKQGWTRLLISMFLLLILPFFIFKEYRVLKPKKRLYEIPEESVMVSQAFSYDEEKSFVVFLCVQDGDRPFLMRSIQSALDQKYEKFRIVLLHVGSDKSFNEEIKVFLNQQSRLEKVSLIQCSSVGHFSDSFAHMIQACRDDEIIIHLDGHDWFAREDILTKLNETYSDPEVWLTYGQFLEYPSFRKGKAKNAARNKKRWMNSRLKTYYAGLYKQLGINSPSTQGPADHSFFAPMVDIAQWHIRFIPDILYIHSARERLGSIGHSPEHVERSIKKSKKKGEKRADCLLFSDDTPEKLKIALESSESHLKGLARVVAIYQSSPENHPIYCRLEQVFPRVIFKEVSADTPLKDVLISLLDPAFSSATHLLFLSDQVIFSRDVHLMQCIDDLEEAKAHGYYLLTTQGEKALQSVQIKPELFAWRLEKRSPIWDPAKLGCSLHSKSAIAKDLEEVRCKQIHSLTWLLQKGENELGIAQEDPPAHFQM